MAKSKKSKKGKKTKAEKKLPKTLRKGDLPRSLGEVWAAGLGALGQARKQGGETFESLVAQGERVVRAGSDSAREALGEVESVAAQISQRVRTTASEAAGGVQRPLERAVEAALGTLGVPTRDEVAALQAVVERLEGQLASLGAAPASVNGAAPEAVTDYEVVPHPDGWAIQKPGAQRALSVVKTKKVALRDARATAREHAPSRLTIYNLDGSRGEVTEYGGD